MRSEAPNICNAQECERQTFHSSSFILFGDTCSIALGISSSYNDRHPSLFVSGSLLLTIICIWNSSSQDPTFWTYRPLSELMIRAAADDVHFLLYIHHKIMEKLSEVSLWRLAVRGALHCRCYCVNDNEQADWPPLPSIPGILTCPALRSSSVQSSTAIDTGRTQYATMSKILTLEVKTAAFRCLKVTLGPIGQRKTLLTPWN